MKNHRVLIETALASDQKALRDIQKNINMWISQELLVKYEMHASSTHIVFNICLKKDADKV